MMLIDNGLFIYLDDDESTIYRMQVFLTVKVLLTLLVVLWIQSLFVFALFLLQLFLKKLIPLLDLYVLTNNHYYGYNNNKGYPYTNIYIET